MWTNRTQICAGVIIGVYLLFGGDRVRLLAFTFFVASSSFHWSILGLLYSFVEEAQLLDRSFGSSSGSDVGLKLQICKGVDLETPGGELSGTRE